MLIAGKTRDPIRKKKLSNLIKKKKASRSIVNLLPWQELISRPSNKIFRKLEAIVATKNRVEQ